jgi:hypothetical protein
MFLPRVTPGIESESGNDMLSSMGLTGFSGKFFNKATANINQEV